MSAADGGRRGARTVGLAIGTTVINSLPLYLVSSLFVQISAGTGAPIAALGAIVAVYWITAGVVSLFVGGIAHRVGSVRLVMIAVSLAGVSFLGTALLTPVWPMIFLWIAIGGAGNALGHPASNHLIALRVSPRRLALAFGLKQSSVPIATLAAGLAVPIIALTLGWQWALGFAALVAVVLIIVFRATAPRDAPADPAAPVVRARLDRRHRPHLLLVAAFGLLGTGALSTAVSFSVASAVQRGIDPGLAGLLLSAASLVGAFVRVLVGIFADRRIGDPQRTVAIMLALGTVGLLLMAWQSDLAFTVGLITAVAFGWGWPGLQFYIVSQIAGAATVPATAIVSMGSYIGNAVTPLVIGLVYSRTNDSPTWIILGSMLGVAAVIAGALSRRQPKQEPVAG